MNNIEQSRATVLTLAVEWALELEKRIKESGTIFTGEVGRRGPWGLLGGWWRCSWGTWEAPFAASAGFGEESKWGASNRPALPALTLNLVANSSAR